MTPILAKLTQLRSFFAVYFVALIGVDLHFSPGWPRLGRYGFTRGGLLVFSILVSALLFALGWWVFHNLLERRRWARTALLMVGWLAVIDALSSFLFTVDPAGTGRWLGRMVPGVEWGDLLMLDRAKDLLGLLYWGLVIWVLQFDAGVKQAFQPPRGIEPGGEGAPRTGPER